MNSLCELDVFISVWVNGDSLSVRPTKVVAGQEAEKTNEFLQAIAKAISNKVSLNFKYLY